MFFAKGLEPLRPALFFKGDISRCLRVWHKLTSRELSLNFEVFQRFEGSEGFEKM